MIWMIGALGGQVAVSLRGPKGAVAIYTENDKVCTVSLNIENLK